MYKNIGLRSNYRIRFSTSRDFEAGNLYGGEIKVTFPAAYADDLGNPGANQQLC